ncbi:hypothetical protein TrVE_jg7962 [Triparma verrucosa]|uniref:Uncharacterized protein n=1 Tax=Triparma verrucosa TaxID=1606542 RepID=A0A9W6ZAN8_9STRA|nr:hypothetical protein TrVE_jg7962 [Triparma verrucosa]
MAQRILRKLVNHGNTTRAWRRTVPVFKAQDNKSPTEVLQVDPRHFQPLSTWTTEEIKNAVASHVMTTWSPCKAKNDLPIITHSSHIYLYDSDGNEYIDWTSQAVCTNSGHSLSQHVKTAINDQVDNLHFVYGGIAMTEIRARLSSLISELLPGDLVGCLFPSSGSEANEAAITMARRYSGRPKILSFYRSYHGGTKNSLSATGDFRRHYQQGSADFVKAFNFTPNFFEHAGADEDERVRSALLMLEEQIISENHESIASIVVESIPGSAGVLTMPLAYMQGVRAICDKYGILLHIDEVMCGFGRTGEMWGFQTYPGVLPDIVTSAKGLSSSIAPISFVAVNERMMEFFEDNAPGWGSTFQGHPVAMAAAYANLTEMLTTNLVGHVQSVAPAFYEHMRHCAEVHPSIKGFRALGLYGALDIATPDGEQPHEVHEARTAATNKYFEATRQNGLLGLFRPPHIHIAPPLIISEEEIQEGFDRQHRALSVLDEELGF